jgi:two-component system phosphate regulon response regulator PhoB
MTEVGVAPSVPTVLVADDDPDLLVLINRRLTKAGYTVICAVNGQEALDLAGLHLPEMAVLDITMPKLTGLEVLEQLRADAATSDMLIIMISAGHWTNLDAHGRPPGADDYVAKPFGPSELRNRVEELFERRG